MKQHITVEQLNELSEKSKEKLWDWCLEIGRIGTEYKKEHKDCPSPHTGDCVTYVLPLLSIGQMIEFLDEHTNLRITKYIITPNEIDKQDLWEIETRVSPVFKYNDLYTRSEKLCDALWEAVKEVLNDK